MMTGSGLTAPVPITSFHKTVSENAFAAAVEGFDCGDAELNTYLARFALHNHRNDSARCYVVMRGEKLAGYYCLTSASLSDEEAPRRVAKGLARHEIPAILLARLAVDSSEQHQGIGSSLVRDALVRTAQAAEIVGCRILIVNAKNDRALRFYKDLDFTPLPGNELHLFLLLKDLRKTLRES